MSLFRLAAVLHLVLAPSLFALGHSRRPDPGFPLFAAANVLLRGNRVACNINDIGEQCVDGTNSPSLAGGFWPRGTRNQYIFSGGLAVSGIIAGNDGPGFPWPGDTVGAFFFDPRGDQAHGSPVTSVHNSLDALDAPVWPAGARAADSSLYHPGILGRDRISDQDTWVRYWDGDFTRTTGRHHPVGIVVDQRTMAWNTPGLEDVVFFVYRFINVSAASPSPYQQLAASGYSPTDIGKLASLGARFQTEAEVRYGVTIPDAGYTVRDFHLSFGQDPDVTANAGGNFSNANLIFRAAFAYHAVFLAERSFVYDPGIHAAPFAAAPGFVSNVWLRTPRTPAGAQVPITMSGNTTGGTPFPDSRGVQQLWRRASGNMLSADGTCNSGVNPKARQFCFYQQSIADTRYWMSVGSVSLAPGQSTVAVMAVILAAPVLAPLQAAGWSIGAGPVILPGFPLQGARLRQGLDLVRPIDRIMGWVSHGDPDNDLEIEINEVTTVPRSLLWKIQRAQAVVDSRFLVPRPPESPQFTIVPGNGAVTVSWEPSATEASGDPYFELAGNPLLGTFDRDYRQNDLEGYRVWRGTSPTAMRVIAQFDLAGTSFTDHSGLFQYGPQCGPELGVTAGCPAFPVSHPLAGEIVMVSPGDRFVTASGSLIIRSADTAATGGGAGRLPLRDTGIPYVFTDSSAVNGQYYYYAVTAFDVNSAASAPVTMDSPLAPRLVRPRSSVAPGAALTTMHAVPDPYYMRTSSEVGNLQQLRLVNLPDRAVIRIYSSSGVLVALLNHSDPSGGGDATWDLRNRGGWRVSSGVYFFHVEAADGRRGSGRFVVINRR